MATSEILNHMNINSEKRHLLFFCSCESLLSVICPHCWCFYLFIFQQFPVTTRKMDELQDVQLTEIKPLLTNKVSLERTLLADVESTSIFQFWFKKEAKQFSIYLILSGKHISLYARHAVLQSRSSKWIIHLLECQRQKTRKELVKKDCGQNEAREVLWITKTEWKRLQSSIWKKSVSQTGENKGGRVSSVLRPLPLCSVSLPD